MSPDLPAAPSHPSLVERGSGAERRRLSVLFADLIGSTDLMEQLGADDYAAALRSYHSLCTEAVRSRGGTVAQYQGDGIMCFFGFPTAREDDATQAVSAALDILATLSAHNEGEDVAIHTRIGIATGTAIVSLGTSHFGGETVGACLNLASRLQDKAAPDTVVICEDTAEMIGDVFRTRDLGRQALKGFAEPRPVTQVTGAATGVVTRFAARSERNNTPRIDREPEGEALMAGFVRAKGGSGCAIGVSGSAGLGKSRIIRDILADPIFAGAPSFVLQCAPEYAAVPLHPVRAYLDWMTGVRRGDDPVVRREKLARLFGVVWQADAEEVDILLDLLAPEKADGPPDGDETATRKRQRGFDVLTRRMFGAIGRARAFVLVFEDIHWIDPTSLEFLGHLLDRVGDYPILLVATCRPEAESIIDALPFDTVLRMAPLAADHSRALAMAATAHYDLEAKAIDRIIALAEGVPLFLEEYARMIAKARDGDPSAPRIPLTLSGIVLSKLDRVDEDARAFAKAASIIGRSFDATVVADIFAIDRDRLERIIAALLNEQIVTQGADDHHVFSHALIRDGIYDMLDLAGRRQHHLRAADWFARSSDKQAPAAVIGGHYAQGNDPKRAIEWFMRAARRAAGDGAASEAMASLTAAAEQVQKLVAGEERDRIELGVRAMQGPVWMVLRGPGSPHFGETQERAHALLEQLDIHETRAPVIFHTALHSWARGRLAESLARVDILDGLERAGGPDDGLMLARKTMRGLVGWHRGRNAECEALLGETVAAYDMARHAPLYGSYLMEFGIFGRFYLALTKTVMGRFDEGAALARDASRIADLAKFPHARGFAQLANFVCAMLRGDVDTCERFADEAFAYSSTQGFPEFVAMATFAKGWVAARRGDFDTGIALMTEGLGNWDRTGFQSWQPIYAALLATDMIAAGRLDEARRRLDAADEAVRATGEEQAAAPLRLARAELARAGGDGPAAEELAREAIALSDAQGAGLWAGRVRAAFPDPARG